MKNKILIIAVVIASFNLIAGCFPRIVSNSSQQSQSIKLNHNPFIYKLHPEFSFSHLQGGSNRLYVKLNLLELMFAPLKSNRSLQGKVQIKYFIYKPDEFENIIDSATVMLEIKKRKGQTNAITYLPVNDNGMKEYYMKIITIDMLKRRAVKNYLYINYNLASSEQNFMVQLQKNGAPYFKPYFRNNQVFSIKYNNAADSIYVKHFPTNIPYPAPPYSLEPYIEPNMNYDTIYNVSGNTAIKFSETNRGLYYFQTDTVDNTGLSMLNCGVDFPYIKSSIDMLYPIKYLCKTQEFEELKNSTNKKLALDRFWLKCGGNMNRSRELIRIYYNRVLYANVYFTSFAEGWKTDRGMIYLIFGTPKQVKKAANKEIWIYSNRLNTKMLQFVFNRISSSYTDNNYILERSNDFRQFWMKAIKSWREGKVYIVFK